MISVFNNFDLKSHNTFGLQARCSKWVEYDKADDLDVLIPMLANQRWMIIGEGSNLLFTKDFDGIILHDNVNSISIKPHEGAADVEVTASAGTKMDSLISYCCNQGLWGLENLSLIPGTVGASAVQNVGAYGVEACDLILRVKAWDMHAQSIVTLTRDQCCFGYRDSLFKKYTNRYIITEVTYGLSSRGSARLEYGNLSGLLSVPGSELTPLVVRETVIALRREKLPDVKETGSAGSFFKNPVVEKEKLLDERLIKIAGKGQSIPHYTVNDKMVKIPAAWLIEKCGFKGKRFGNVAVWEKQPLVIVNLTGHATAGEIIKVASEITEAVNATFGISLHREVQYV